ncbi:MAG TPA: DUF401 family protein [Bacillota bacterium]|nr:DUF401 family protein [Bacillota bacterium]HOA15774.1 DUF401 family protein [Bacillota bacterium]HOG53131.1 DUF401 family protein [Bacillota bacterium]
MNTAILVVISLAVVLALIRLKVPNGIAMAAGGIVVILASGMGLGGILRTVGTTLGSAQTQSVLATMLLVIVLEQLMTNFGLTDRLVASLGRLIPDKRVHMVLLPAFMGLLPSAGGALLSCPMVDRASDGSEASPEKKAFANFWFRHIMEFIAPVYTAIIILAQITKLPMASLLRAMLPMALVATAVGIPVAFRGTRKPAPRPSDGDGKKRDALRGLVLSVLPLAAVLIMVITFGLSPIVALIPVILALIAIYRPKPPDYRKMAANVFNPAMIGMIIGLMFYKDALTGSGGIEALGSTFSGFGLSMPLLALLLPFAVGFLTGMSSVTMALVMPILISMYGIEAITPQLAALSYTGCNMGMNLTPTHLCLVLTVDYFKVDLIKVIGLLLLPAMAVMAAALLILA